MTKNILKAIYRAAKRLLRGTKLDQIYPFSLLNDLWLRHIKSDFAIVQGHRMHLDAKDSLQLSVHGVYEKFEMEFLKGESKAGNVIVDIGANIGYYTLMFAKQVGPQGRVYAFEPDPSHFALLRRNVEENGYRNVDLVNLAVTAATGKLKLFLNPENLGDHRVYDSGDSRKSVEIQGVSLDEYLRDKGAVDLIKLDIQGGEFGALQGAYGVLEKTPRIAVVSEFWPAGLRRAGTDPAAVLEVFVSRGFLIYELDEKLEKLVPRKAPELLERFSGKSEAATNLYFRRQPRQVKGS